MSIGSRLRHHLAIERGVGSTVDDYNQPVTTPTTVAYVRGLVQPKTIREMAQANQAGAGISDHTVFLFPVDVRPSDQIRYDPDDGRRYEVSGPPRDAGGIDHHLEVDVRLVSPGVPV